MCSGHPRLLALSSALQKPLFYVHGSQIFSLIPSSGFSLAFWPPELWVWLQPEELTLLLIQLRRHQAKMASVHSPSYAFAHLQHHQHNGLLGPSMQVRGSYTGPLPSSAHCIVSKHQCIVVPTTLASPIRYIPLCIKDSMPAGLVH